MIKSKTRKLYYTKIKSNKKNTIQSQSQPQPLPIQIFEENSVLDKLNKINNMTNIQHGGDGDLKEGLDLIPNPPILSRFESPLILYKDSLENRQELGIENLEITPHEYLHLKNTLDASLGLENHLINENTQELQKLHNTDYMTLGYEPHNRDKQGDFFKSIIHESKINKKHSRKKQLRKKQNHLKK